MSRVNRSHRSSHPGAAVARGLARTGLAVALTVAALAAPALLSRAPADAAIDAQSLGGRYDATGSTITFRVYSSAATRVAVYLYQSPTGAAEQVSYPMTRDATTSVWSVSVSVSTLRTTYGITGPVYYGYRAWGPNWTYDPTWRPGSSAGFRSDVDSAGNRFNPNKLLIDPYAREISHDPVNPSNTDKTVYASGPSYRAIDSGPYAPKSIVLADDSTSTGTKPTRALKDDVIYEVNLRGLSRGDASVASAYQGTYRGAAAEAGRLSALGVTAVEFLPVQDFQNDANDVNPTSTSGDNYWGYDPLDWFAPDRRYSSDKTAGGPTREFKAMVKTFHDAGVKVLMDVVYNHTGEGGAWNSGDTGTYSLLSWRGLDNPTYYSLTSDKQSSWDNTGVGGNVNTYNPIAQNLIVDSVAYWKNTMGVDGFRFDLAPVLGNTCQHGCFNYSSTDPNTALRRLVAEMPARPAGGGSGTDWIAEPWAIGAGTYQLGNFPPGWSEWNGDYRDTMRRSQNKLGVDDVTPAQLATRFAGSSDLFGDDGRRPWNSIDFMVAHDGFTLDDLYSCNAKNNGQAWPYGPSDGGTDDNLSWDQGGIAADQRKAARNGLSFLMLSAGTPMMTGGDEYLRSLRCNNNPYNVDSVANWLSYSWTSDQSTFDSFAKGMIAFRRAHPALRPVGYYSSADNNGNGLPQMSWFTPAGATPDSTYWNSTSNHDLAWRVDGTEFGDPAGAIYVGYNGWSGDVTFTLPSPGSGRQWYRVTDTSSWAEGPNQVASPGSEAYIGGQGTTYVLHGRGLLLLIAK